MKKIFTIGCLIFSLFFLSHSAAKVFAEGGTGSIPSSGATSRIKTINDALDLLGFGNSGSGAWGDWGSMWNRIYSASIWNATLGDAVTNEVFSGKKFYAGANRNLLTGTFSFTGDATESDVVAGKTFYSGNSTKLTGTYSAPASIDYSLQQYSARDDNGGPNGSGAEDYQGEESTWTSSVENVWKDTRTGLYWSNDKGSMTNNFTLNSCDFFNTTPRGNYAGGDPDCGVAINYCATLVFGDKSDWYLPSQKEAMQAFIDGMYNQAGTNLEQAAAFAGPANFWSSSERSNSDSNAWYYNMGVGTMNITVKGSGSNVRCVRRD